MNILVVEDELLFKMIYREFFDNKQVQHQFASSLQEARLILQQNLYFDAVILDNQLTDGEGVTLVPALKAAFSDAAVLMVSANSNPEFFLQAYAAGLDDYALKPINLELLWVKLCRAVELKRLQQVAGRQQAELQKWIAVEQQEQALAMHVLSSLTQSLQQMPAFVRTASKPSCRFNGDILLHQQAPNGSFYLLLADAMGHGLAAAISLMPVLEVFQTMTKKGLPVANIVFELNQKLRRQLSADRFVAAVLLRIDPLQQLLEIWNGGLPPLMLLQTPDAPLRLVKSTHMALGVLADHQINLQTEQIQWQPSCRIIGLTDGVTDVLHYQGAALDIPTLANLFQQSPAELFNQLVTLIDGTEDNSDDITFFECDLTNIQLEQSEEQCIHLNEGKVNIGLKIEGCALQRSEVPLRLLSLLVDYGLSKKQCDALFSVLTELYLNGLEHGVLQLDSKMKEQSNGFADYYALKDRRLQMISGDDFVEIKLSLNVRNRQVEVFVVDSGCGFEYESLNGGLQGNNKLYGRGIDIVGSLCSEVIFKGRGNEVCVVMNG